MGDYLKITPPQSDFSVALIKSYQGPTSLTLSTRYFNKVEMMPTKFTQIQTLNKGNLALRKKKRSFTWVHKCDMQSQLILQWDADLKCKLFKLPQTCAHVSYSKAVTHTLHYKYIIHVLGTHYTHISAAKGITSQERGYCILQTNLDTLKSPHFLLSSSVWKEISFTDITYVPDSHRRVCSLEGPLWKHWLC